MGWKLKIYYYLSAEEKGLEMIHNQLELFLEHNPYFRTGENGFLHMLLLKLPHDPRILEIGTFRGWSAILMAQAREDAFIVTIDPHIGIPEDELISSYGEAMSNFISEKVDSRIAHYPCYSDDFNPVEKYDLIFLDGDHTYLGVQHDFFKFLPFVKDTGIILFHDFNGEKGVTEFCNTLKYRGAKRFKSMLAIRKCDLC